MGNFEKSFNVTFGTALSLIAAILIFVGWGIAYQRLASSIAESNSDWEKWEAIWSRHVVDVENLKGTVAANVYRVTANEKMLDQVTQLSSQNDSRIDQVVLNDQANSASIKQVEIRLNKLEAIAEEVNRIYALLLEHTKEKNPKGRP